MKQDKMMLLKGWKENWMSAQRVWDSFWTAKDILGRCCRYAVYLVDRGSLVPFEFKLLEVVWTGKELKYYHLRTFGCTTYVRVNPNKSDNLDAKPVKCYLIGYDVTCSGTSFGILRTRASWDIVTWILMKMLCTRTKRRKVLGQRSKWELKLSCGKIHLVML